MQTRRGSATEALTGTFVGFLVSWALTYTVLPLFGYDVGAVQATGITAIYTLASVVRSYALRRFFNWLDVRVSAQKIRYK